MSRDLDMKGLADVMNVLTVLPKNLQTNGMRQMLGAMANPIMDDAKQRAAMVSPKVAKAIRKGSARKNQDGTFSIRIYVDERREDGWLGYLIETGTRPHMITLRRDRKGKAGRNAAARAANGQKVPKAFTLGGEVASGTIMHPGVRAHPFLVPALDIRADDAIRAGSAKLAQFLEGKTGFDANAALAEAT